MKWGLILSIAAAVTCGTSACSDASKAARSTPDDPYARVDQHYAALIANIDDKGIEEKVAELVEQGERSEAFELLRRLGDRGVPALLRALKDPRSFVPRKDSGLSLQKFPAESVIEVLAEVRPLAAVPDLVPLVSHPEEEIRKATALALARIAAPDCVDPVKTALSDPDAYVRSYALIGIRKAVDDGKMSPEFRERVFPAVAALLDRDDESLSDAADTLLLLDREKAVATILDDKVFIATNPIISRNLEALNDHEVLVPAAKVHRILEAVRGDVGKYPNDQTYGQCLIALARTDDAKAQQLIAEGLKHSNKRVAEAAGEALIIRKGLSKVMDRIWNRYSTHDGKLSRLTKVEQNIIGVRLFIDQVNNGGLSQYFFNTGDNVEPSLAGLKAIGATESESILKEAVSIVGRKISSADQDKRGELLEKLSKKADAQLETLNDRFFEDPDRIESKLNQYIADQSESIKALPKPDRK